LRHSAQHKCHGKPSAINGRLQELYAHILNFKTLHMNTRKLYVCPERAYIYGFHIILTLNSDYFLWNINLLVFVLNKQWITWGTK
jgi:hypothetical protein